MLIFADCNGLGIDVGCDCCDFCILGLSLVLIFADCNDSGLMLVVIVAISKIWA